MAVVAEPMRTRRLERRVVAFRKSCNVRTLMRGRPGASPGGYTIEATDGDFTAWTQLWNVSNQIAAESNPQTRFNLYQQLQGLNPDGSRNPAFPVLLDVDNLVDYMNVIFYGGNLDAPISNFLSNNSPNNWFGIRNRVGEEGFQFFAPI